MSVYEAVRAYHETHGDDFGSLRSRIIRYDAAIAMLPDDFTSMLDVGCGSGEFRRWWNGDQQYTGIDLLAGTNVLDWTERRDVVVALGVLYLVPPTEQKRLVKHMWKLARQALIVQTLTKGEEGEFPVDPSAFAKLAWSLTPKIALRNDYLLNDVTIGLYR